jgi:hypothetical protein
LTKAASRIEETTERVGTKPFQHPRPEGHTGQIEGEEPHLTDAGIVIDIKCLFTL